MQICFLFRFIKKRNLECRKDISTTATNLISHSASDTEKKYNNWIIIVLNHSHSIASFTVYVHNDNWFAALGKNHYPATLLFWESGRSFGNLFHGKLIRPLLWTSQLHGLYFVPCCEVLKSTVKNDIFD